MPITGIKQPEIINIDSMFRLRRADKCEWVIALPWYENPLVLYFSEGIESGRVYDIKTVYKMYTILSSIGELYFIEVNEDNVWKPIGDVGLSEYNMPIVIGDQKYWGKGIGRKVLSALIIRAKLIGLKRTSVTIYKYNQRSRRLFTSVGFVKVGESKLDESFELTL